MPNINRASGAAAAAGATPLEEIVTAPTVTEHTMTVDGGPVAAAGTFGVINPATGSVFADAPDCTKRQLDAAMESAQRAFLGDWRHDQEARRAALRAAADAVDADIDVLAALLTAEQGKPLKAARDEVASVGVCMRWFADLEIPREILQDDARGFAEVLRKPQGVVAALTPWNYPLILATYKIAPALLAGNTMVLKPSPFTPLATLRMGEVLRSALPPGVLNVVSGGDELGEWMTAHPIPAKLTLTGSVPTGKKVALAAARDLKRVTLELGGNDPAILLDDVDVDAVADMLFWTAFTNTGQICSAIKRVYAPERIYDSVVEALADRARRVKVGDGAVEGTELGPLNNKPQFDRISELVADAVGGGARVAAGGGPLPGPGYFFEPTILADIEDGVRIVDEEQFGPALPVIPYGSLDEALSRANQTSFGLGGSVWSRDEERAAKVGERLEAGTVWINSHAVFAAHLPFAGRKLSGLGVENGTFGYYAYTEIQVLYRNRG
jgi:acyl-CoA reductase-like NAD-dependent aldehyde dehydrogenase